MGKTTAVAFIDGLALILLIFLIMPHNPSASQESNGCGANGFITEISWPNDWYTDVDMLIRSPDDSVVYFGRKDGVTINLLRDDLGLPEDLSKVNYELSCSRGTPDGEYIFNVHLYRNYERKYPVPVGMVIRQHLNGRDTVVFEELINLEHVNDEVTAIRLIIKDNKIVGTNKIQRRLSRNGE